MRLIDADKLMDSLKGNVLIDVTPELEDTIAQQPTAFDKEKVIEELQKHSHNYYPSIDHYCLSRKAVDLKDAIEIVEKGGIE